MQDEDSSGGVQGEAELAFAEPAAQQSFTMVYDAVLTDPELSAVAVRVYGLLSMHARRKGACWPGMDVLCREAGIGETALRAALNELKARRLVTARRRGQGRSNVYRLFTPWAPAPADEPSPAPSQGSRPSESEDQDPRNSQDEAEEGKQRVLFAPLRERAAAVAAPPNLPDRREASDYRSLWSAFETGLSRRPAGAAERGRWGKGIKGLVGEVSAEQVEQACAEYLRRYPDLPANPQAIAGQISDLLTVRAPVVRRAVAWDARYSARERAGVEAAELDRLGAAMRAAEERSRRGSERLHGPVGEIAEAVAARLDSPGGDGRVVADDPALPAGRRVAGA